MVDFEQGLVRRLNSIFKKGNEADCKNLIADGPSGGLRFLINQLLQFDRKLFRYKADCCQAWVSDLQGVDRHRGECGLWVTLHFTSAQLVSINNSVSICCINLIPTFLHFIPRCTLPLGIMPEGWLPTASPMELVLMRLHSRGARTSDEERDQDAQDAIDLLKIANANGPQYIPEDQRIGLDEVKSIASCSRKELNWWEEQLGLEGEAGSQATLPTTI